MELIDYIDGLFIDVPSIPDYWITAIINTAFEGHASIWYIEMKEIHGRRHWPWWKSQIIQKYSNDTWIWKKTMSFENDKYSVEKDTYEWCLRQSKRLKAIDPQMNIQMSNQKILTQMQGEPEHAVKCRCNHNFTLDNIENTLQKIRKRTNIGKHSPYKSSVFREKQPFRVEFKHKPRERVAEVTKKKNSFHNCGSIDHYANNCPKEKKKVYAIEKVPGEEYPTEDSESDSMGDAIRDQNDEEQDPREEFLVEYQEETPLEIQDIQLEEGMPQDTSNKTLCKHTQDSKTFLVTPSFLLGTDSQRIYGIDIYNGKNRHITIGTNKEKKFVLDIYQISSQDPQEELLNELREGQFSTTLTSKQKLSLLKIMRKDRPAFAIGEEPLCKIGGHDIELYLDVERSYPPILRRPPYPEGLETRKEIEKHIKEFLDIDVIRNIGHNEIVEMSTPFLITWNDGKSRLCGDFRALNNYTKADRYPIPRITNALDKLAKDKYITKMDCMKGFHQNGFKPNSMKLLRIICHMGIYQYTRMPFGIKNAPTHFERMMDTIFQEEILEGWMVVYIDDIIMYTETWEVHVQYIQRVLRHKVSGLSRDIDQNKVAEVLLKPVPKNIKEMQSFLGFSSYYRNHIRDFSHITSSLYKLCSKHVVFEITKERRYAYERIKHELTNAPVLILPDFELTFKLYIDAACSQGLGAALHQRQSVDGEPKEGVIC
ncbi:hypothetical protein O181_037188 [Austropuccinia psidii MF-1]|uniref:Reverse transcriptase domain-containing protein n=1 Tax=Austropuccinia psidii MF-1 TaxID=1389203 RepID=A0A9Q3DAX5_9BASI|nr:hypothetical protein [Austropuccinia psidii MF-1]